MGGLSASISLFRGGSFGRYLGIAVGSIAALEALLAIPAYPFLSLAIFALSLWIIHGLTIYREPESQGYYERVDAEVPDAGGMGPEVARSLPQQRPA